MSTATAVRPATIKPAEAALLLQFAPLVAAALVSTAPARELERAERAEESHGWIRRPGRWSMAGTRGIRGGEADGRQDVAVRWDQLAALVARIRAERPDLLPELADARAEWDTARGPVIYLRKDDPARPAALERLAAADAAMLAAVRACLTTTIRAPRGFEPVPVPARPFRFVDALRFALEDTEAGRAALAAEIATAETAAAAPAAVVAVVADLDDAGPLELPGLELPAPARRSRRLEPAPALFELEAPARVGHALARYVGRARGRAPQLAEAAPLALFG